MNEMNKNEWKFIILTDSWNSGSDAEASHRLLRIKIFGFEILPDTSWKNDFS